MRKQFTRARSVLVLYEQTRTVADLEIQKGGLSHWRAKRARKFLGCHAHFRSRWNALEVRTKATLVSRPSQMSGDQ